MGVGAEGDKMGAMGTGVTKWVEVVTKWSTLHSPTYFLRNPEESWNSGNEEISVNFPSIIPGPFLIFLTIILIIIN